MCAFILWGGGLVSGCVCMPNLCLHHVYMYSVYPCAVHSFSCVFVCVGGDCLVCVGGDCLVYVGVCVHVITFLRLCVRVCTCVVAFVHGLYLWVWVVTVLGVCVSVYT